MMIHCRAAGRSDVEQRTLVVGQDISSTGWRGGLARRVATKSSRGGWGTDGRHLIRSLRGGRLHLWWEPRAKLCV